MVFQRKLLLMHNNIKGGIIIMKKLYASLDIDLVVLNDEIVRTSGEEEQPTVNEQGFFDGTAENLWD